MLCKKITKPIAHEKKEFCEMKKKITGAPKKLYFDKNLAKVY